jgi:hypothetical protein
VKKKKSFVILKPAKRKCKRERGRNIDADVNNDVVNADQRRFDGQRVRVQIEPRLAKQQRPSRRCSQRKQQFYDGLQQQGVRKMKWTPFGGLQSI